MSDPFPSKQESHHPILTRRAVLISALTTLSLSTFVPASVAKTVVRRPSSARPSQWAVPVEIDGAPNLYRINQRLYRSAQPNAEGFAAVANDLSVKTIVNLRALHADDGLVQGTGLEVVRVPIHCWNLPVDRIVLALHHIRDASERNPVLIHCNHGADRTGLVIALYRTLYNGWTKTAAVQEMIHGGYGFNLLWDNNLQFIDTVAVEQLRGHVEAL